jgi:phosphoribosyl-ATP pyrophosphohydrolase/phosphoribosyl-AMP cyclohydrolase
MSGDLRETLQFERRGDQDLLPVVAQDFLTGEIRMLAWANREAVDKTLATGLATFWSRSRQALWTKGETSGNGLAVQEILVDCDADALIYVVSAKGPTCHTGAPTCFFRRLDGGGSVTPATALGRLDAVLAARREASAEKSYTKSLYDGGPAKIGAKLREEASELAVAVEREADERVVSEAADVLFHAMVALRSRGLGIEAVYAELERRAGTSGHTEKAGRIKPTV